MSIASLTARVEKAMLARQKRAAHRKLEPGGIAFAARIAQVYSAVAGGSTSPGHVRIVELIERAQQRLDFADLA